MIYDLTTMMRIILWIGACGMLQWQEKNWLWDFVLPFTFHSSSFLPHNMINIRLFVGNTLVTRHHNSICIHSSHLDWSCLPKGRSLQPWALYKVTMDLNQQYQTVLRRPFTGKEKIKIWRIFICLNPSQLSICLWTVTEDLKAMPM